MEYDENEMMNHLMSYEMFAANIATYLFELHKRIEEIDKRTTVLIIPLRNLFSYYYSLKSYA